MNKMFLSSNVLLRQVNNIRKMSTAVAKKLEGRVAIVTASTEGIGFAIAKRLAEDGAKVVVSSRREGNVSKALAELHEAGHSDVIGLKCNVSSEKDRINLVEQTMSQFGAIDILVSNAAVNPTMSGVLDVSEPVWDKIFDVNVKSALILSQLVVPHMQKNKRGSIIYVSSIAAFTPMTALGPYGISKTALLGLCKTLALEVAPDNIRANCIAPGIVQTKFSQPLTSNEGIKEKMLEMIPLGRVAQPHEMTGLVSFLASDDASYITGENFVAAGGMASRL